VYGIRRLYDREKLLKFVQAIQTQNFVYQYYGELGVQKSRKKMIWCMFTSYGIRGHVTLCPKVCSTESQHRPVSLYIFQLCIMSTNSARLRAVSVPEPRQNYRPRPHHWLPWLNFMPGSPGKLKNSKFLAFLYHFYNFPTPVGEFSRIQRSHYTHKQVPVHFCALLSLIGCNLNYRIILLTLLLQNMHILKKMFTNPYLWIGDVCFA